MKFKLPTGAMTLTSLGILELFWPLGLFERMAKHSQAHFDSWRLAGKYGGVGSHPQSDKPFTEIDMAKFFGMQTFMAVVKMPAYRDYWKGDIWSGGAMPQLNHVMPRNRYEHIRRFWNICDRDEAIAKRSEDPLFRIRLIYDLLNKCFRRYGEPGTHLALDEGMQLYHGHHKFRIRIKGKPDGHGFKYYIISDSKTGYVFQVKIATGEEKDYPSALDGNMTGWPPADGGAPKPREKYGAEGAVLELVEAANIAPGSHLYVDRWYTTVRLFVHLYTKYGIFATGSLVFIHSLAVSRCVHRLTCLSR